MMGGERRRRLMSGKGCGNVFLIIVSSQTYAFLPFVKHEREA
jgi:hypothetical protein